MPQNADAVKAGTKLSRGANFRCLISGVPITGDYIKSEGQARRVGARLMAIVLEGDRGRVYMAPTQQHESVANQQQPKCTQVESVLVGKCRDQLPLYGMNTFADIFTSRQLLALTTFSDLVSDAVTLVRKDAIAAGFADDEKLLREGGEGAAAYAEAVGVYLAFAVDKCSDYWSSICTWHTSRDNIRSTFGRHALPMVWDYAETNPFSGSSGNWMAMIDWIWKAVQFLPATAGGAAIQEEAQRQSSSKGKIVSTDPPYYDNIDYADLSDFFYVWLMRSLKSIFPDLFLTLAVPKLEELVATPRRHGSKEKAEEFFLNGMTQAIKRIAEQAHPCFPVTVYYAFKQSENKNTSGIRRTGWETFLEAVIESGFSISGTWPVRTELANKLLGFNANILASSIVLVCRKHFLGKPAGTRSEFVDELKTEIPLALRCLQESNVAPVDLAQAAIGPGMAVYTRYSKVLDAEGNTVSVRDALELINQILDEVLVEREGDFDSDTRWALTWFEQYGFSNGPYGVAETLSKAKNTSIDGLVDARILSSEQGTVRLLKPDELAKGWDAGDIPSRPTVWEIVHYLVSALEVNGELFASDFIAHLGGVDVSIESARELSYRLYVICERQNYLVEARSYNSLVQSWAEITRLALEKKTSGSTVQIPLFDK